MTGIEELKLILEMGANAKEGVIWIAAAYFGKALLINLIGFSILSMFVYFVYKTVNKAIQNHAFSCKVANIFDKAELNTNIKTLLLKHLYEHRKEFEITDYSGKKKTPR